ncbi:hypothetical protein [Staphylococcus phage vB_SauH_DELF3]|nr:hypothetical protein [Staphylococcus phage vB_SauH_DELF3]
MHGGDVFECLRRFILKKPSDYYAVGKYLRDIVYFKSDGKYGLPGHYIIPDLTELNFVYCWAKKQLSDELFKAVTTLRDDLWKEKEKSVK